MEKREFLDVLQQSLNGEVSSDVIEQNIRYYDQYISAQSAEEEARAIEMLGDPRLIAKTVIETDRASKQKGSNKANHNPSDNSGKYDSNKDYSSHNDRNHGRNIFFTNFTWKQKLTMILIMIVVFIVLIFIGRIIIGFLFAFGVPILLVLLLFALFRKRN